MSTEELAFWVIQALWGLIVAILGIFLSHLMKRHAANEVMLHQLHEELLRSYVTKVEFIKEQEFNVEQRHNIKQSIQAIEIRLGAWKPE